MDTVKALAGDKFDQAKFDELKDADGFVTKEALLALAAPIEPTEPTESAAVTEAEPVAAKEAPAPITMKAEEIKQKVVGDYIILPFQNGIYAEEKIKNFFGIEKTFGAVAQISAYIDKNQTIQHVKH